MSDSIKHECGIAMIRLLKPVDFYLKKYGSALYGLNKMHLLMEKQHNRGQDGAGLANIKLYPEPGCVYIDRERSNTATPIKDVFQRIESRIAEATAKNPERLRDAQWLKRHVGFTGEVFLGHLRYGTFGKNNIENVHPVSRENNWMTRSLVLAGNFNLTNIDELFRRLIELGQYPPATTDTVTILERIGHFLDRENDDKYRYFKDKGYSKQQITDLLAKHIDLKEVVSLAARRWDGGYVMAGMIGHGDAFVMRDPCGIRPAFYYRDDEVVVAASERAVIQTVFNKPYEQVRELEPGHVLIVRRDGDFSVEPFTAPQPIRPCSFERIYFSRGATATSTANASGWARCSCRKSCAASTTTSKIRFSPIFPIRPRAPFSDWSEDWTNTASISAPKGFFTRTARSPNSGSRRSCGSSPVSRKWRSRTSRCGRSSRRTTTATIWWPTSTTSPTARYVPGKTIW